MPRPQRPSSPWARSPLPSAVKRKLSLADAASLLHVVRLWSLQAIHDSVPSLPRLAEVAVAKPLAPTRPAIPSMQSSSDPCFAAMMAKDGKRNPRAPWLSSESRRPPRNMLSASVKSSSSASQRAHHTPAPTMRQNATTTPTTMPRTAPDDSPKSQVRTTWQSALAPLPHSVSRSAAWTASASDGLQVAGTQSADRKTKGARPGRGGVRLSAW
mmetsp:Transcript_19115/g.73075  ORF Transcript_19115/g.73075 Transcript_19115/m.73075 type:complete len:213 (+) Transcript_19115:588-1226(+)